MRLSPALIPSPPWAGTKEEGRHMNVVHRRRHRGLLSALALMVVAALGLIGSPQPASAAITGNTIAAPGGKCVDVSGDDTGVNGTAVQLWDCQSAAADQHWT